MEKAGILIVIDLSKEKLELTYPCAWDYRVIGADEAKIKSAILEIILEKPHKLNISNQSKTGKYKSFNLELIVSNEDERLIIYDSLRKHPDIKMVL